MNTFNFEQPELVKRMLSDLTSWLQKQDLRTYFMSPDGDIISFYSEDLLRSEYDILVYGSALLSTDSIKDLRIDYAAERLGKFWERIENTII
jgi:hypothetical protein